MLGREQEWVRKGKTVKATYISYTILLLFIMDLSRKNIIELARELRKNQTSSEKVLWESIRKRKLRGLRFNRQKPFVHTQYGNQRYFYIADFYCAEYKLVIEVDGKVHDQQIEYDRQRTIVLENLGLKVLRIKNEELMDLESVRRKILDAVGLK